MKPFFALLLMGYACYSQVGIGTNTPNSSSLLEISATDKAFVPPRMTNSQMLAISHPSISSIVYNTTFNTLYIYNSLGWKSMQDTDNSNLICKKSGGTLTVTNNTYYNFPLNSSNVLSQNSSTYDVISNGKIKIKENGIYMIGAQLSVNNMPSGTKAYSIAVYKNGSLIGLLNKNESIQSSNDYWGASGIMTFNLRINDEIDIKYLINNNTNLNLVYAAFSFIKIN
ncbi:hypothetical protein FIA58_018515 [Flavobacterium jejuense]|uniref:TNF family profile domain-containing protein n=1 Tax=Flavobacterium jejuense TaxID=1544455 RepID=A0ABX0IXX2_9FLAO|nr:hypothetical protein [Flavobacterium jejuense]NHN27679.1 hypothetical protein [Flavobacterium jejuense]